MSNELTLNASLAYADSADADELLAVVNKLANVSTKLYAKGKQSIGITEEAIDIGSLTAPSWALFINRDATNYIELKVATGGAIFAKLLAGEPALLRLGSGAQAPFAIANTAACILEYIIIEL